MMKAKVYILDVDAVKSNSAAVLSALSDGQIAEIEKFKDEREKLLRIAGAYLINTYTPKAPLRFGKYGKPLKDGAFFNLSHSGDLAALAVAETEIGVDVEKIKPINAKTLNSVLSETERLSVSSDEDFFKVWTAKESLLKCVGSGLIRRLTDVPSTPDGEINYLGEKYFSRSLSVKGHIFCVTLKTAEPFELEVTQCGF